MTYGQIVGLTFIVFNQIVALILVSRFVSLLSALVHEDIRKHGSASDHIADTREAKMSVADDKKDRVIGFK